jgi:hypothetical protein
LRALPVVPLPDAALDEVWAKTLGADTEGAPTVSWRTRAGAILAVAASLLVVVLAVEWSRQQPNAPIRTATVVEPAPDEIERARAEAESVLEITAFALARSERAAFERVLGGEVSPAIRKIGIQWPEPPAPKDRRSKT